MLRARSAARDEQICRDNQGIQDSHPPLALIAGRVPDVGGAGHTERMVIEVRAATEFDEVAALVGPKKPTSNVCFCLSYRIGSKENQGLRGQARADRVRELCEHDPPPGVIAYLDGEPVGWVRCTRAETPASPATASSRMSTNSTSGRCGASVCGRATASRRFSTTSSLAQCRTPASACAGC